MKRLRRYVYNLLNPDDDNRLGKSLDTFIILLIAVNVIMVILETDEGLSGQYKPWFVGFEWFSSLFFTAEYLLRIWSCVEDPRYRRPVVGRLKYAKTFMAQVDLWAILPFYLPMVIELDLRFVRAIRLFRLFRLFKMGRYSTSIKTIVAVFARRKEELAMTVFVVVIVLVMASSVLYFVENSAQPEAFASIPDAMWWGVATLTTVGYGDIYPITGLGRFLGSVIALTGVGMVALPAGLIASGFNEMIQEQAGKLSKMRHCPRCGFDLSRFKMKGIKLDAAISEHLQAELERHGITASVEAHITEYELAPPDDDDADDEAIDALRAEGSAGEWEPRDP